MNTNPNHLLSSMPNGRCGTIMRLSRALFMIKPRPPVTSLHPHAYQGRVTYRTHWGEQDPYGHLNNVSYLRHLESGRLEYLYELGRRFMKPGELETVAEGKPMGIVLRKIEVAYEGMVVHPAQLTIGHRVRSWTPCRSMWRPMCE